MAGQFTGMDIQGVRSLAQLMKSKAEEIRSTMQTLTGQIDGTQWVGQDREQFKNDWQSQHCAALTRVIQGLEDASNRATQNASQQETASNT